MSKKIDFSGFDEEVKKELDFSGFDEEINKQEIGAGEAFARGVAEDLSFGFADELAAATETLGAIPEKGLDKEALLEQYRKSLGESRAAYKAAEEAHPGAYMGGQATGLIAPLILTGGLSAIPAIGGKALVKAGAKQAGKTLAKKATKEIGKEAIAKAAKTGAAMGGLGALGMSEADLTKGEFGEALTDVATGATIGAALPGAVGMAGRGIKKGLGKAKKVLTPAVKKVTAFALDTSVDNVQRVLDNPQIMKQKDLYKPTIDKLQKSLKQVNDQIAYLNKDSKDLLSTKKDISIDNVLDDLEDFRQYSLSAADSAAGGKLKKIEEEILKRADIDVKKYKDIDKKISQQVSRINTAVGDAQKVDAEDLLDFYERQMSDMLKGAKLSERDLKSIIEDVGRVAYEGVQTTEAGATKKALRRYREQLSDQLKQKYASRVPEEFATAYTETLDELSKRYNLLDDFQDTFKISQAELQGKELKRAAKELSRLGEDVLPGFKETREEGISKIISDLEKIEGAYEGSPYEDLLDARALLEIQKVDPSVYPSKPGMIRAAGAYLPKKALEKSEELKRFSRKTGRSIREIEKLLGDVTQVGAQAIARREQEGATEYVPPYEKQEEVLRKIDSVKSEKGIGAEKYKQTVDQAMNADSERERAQADFVLSQSPGFKQQTGIKSFDEERSPAAYEDINKPFLESVEGSRDEAYIPQRGGKVLGQSGVTIGRGVDLGQRSYDELKRAGLSDETLAKLQPYFGLKKQEAVDYLKSNPLKLSTAEIEELNEVVGRKLYDDFQRTMTRHGIDIESQPEGVESALYSLFYQYGDFTRRIPRQGIEIIRALKQGDMDALARAHVNFGDPTYRKRRMREAALYNRS